MPGKHLSLLQQGKSVYNFCSTGKAGCHIAYKVPESCSATAHVLIPALYQGFGKKLIGNFIFGVWKIGGSPGK